MVNGIIALTACKYQCYVISKLLVQSSGSDLYLYLLDMRNVMVRYNFEIVKKYIHIYIYNIYSVNTMKTWL